MAKKERTNTREAVARAAGVSVYTVSVAMRGLAGVAPATRARVLEAAKRLGYEPDAVAAMMAQRRHQGRQDRLRIVLLAELDYAYNSARKAFATAGMDLIWRRPSEFSSPEAASRQLWHEGVSGLVVSLDQGPWSKEETLRFDWRKFAAVKPNRGSPQLPFHLVRHSPFDYMEETIRRVLHAGYRAISILLMRSTSERDNDARYGSLLNWQAHKLPAGATLRWREIPGGDPRQLDAGTLDWLGEEPVDALILYHWIMIYPLLEAGWRIPAEVAAAAVLNHGQRHAGIPLMAGCDVQEVDQYARAAILLRDLILRGERGFPAHPSEQVIEPVWIDGETLPTR